MALCLIIIAGLLLYALGILKINDCGDGYGGYYD